MSALLPSNDRPTDVPRPDPRAARGSAARDARPRTRRAAPAAAGGRVGRRGGDGRGRSGNADRRGDRDRPGALPRPPPAPEPRVAFDGNVSVPGRELTSFGDGAWQVGADVVPGTYTSAGGPDCQYTLRAAVTGSDIVANTVGPGPATVVLTRTTATSRRRGAPPGGGAPEPSHSHTWPIGDETPDPRRRPGGRGYRSNCNWPPATFSPAFLSASSPTRPIFGRAP